MRILILALLVIFMIGCATQSNISKLPNAQIFVERPENNGSINIVRCLVQLNESQKIILSGGQTNFFSLKPGTYFLTANSVNPYDPSSREMDWNSNQLKIAVTNSQIMKIILEPNSKDSIYIGGWILTIKNL